MFRATFWGVRGSIPAPGPDTVETGGNTSCVELRCGATCIVFDGGTGLRLLGNELAKQPPAPIHLFFSHVHWDHIQGFPFFAPAFVAGTTIHMYGSAEVSGRVENALAGQMETPNFPVKLWALPARLVFRDLREGEVLDLPGGARVTCATGNHPGGVLAYRVDYEGRSFVYATDTEHYAVPDPKLVKLARGADVLVYDSMYTPEEYAGAAGPPKTGWGHSTFEHGVALAKAAAVRKYVLFHHDPGQDDAAVREKERRARALFAESVAAREGLTIDV